MSGKIRYAFSAIPWQHAPPGGWYFVSMPAAMAKEIRDLLGGQEEGWGRMKATARIGHSDWETAIWFDTRHGTYVLPLKAEIRRKESIVTGKEIEVIIWV